MATEKQIAANRQNALKSPGPTSVLGKMISSRNSTSHGFYASNVLLPEEDRQEFLRFARGLVFAHAPRDTLEAKEVKTVIETQWQLQRANLVDSELFQIFGNYEGQYRGVGTAFANDAGQANAFSKSVRYHGFLIRKLQIAEGKLAVLKSRPAVLPHKVKLGPAAVLGSARIPVATAESQRNEIGPLDILNWLHGREPRGTCGVKE